MDKIQTTGFQKIKSSQNEDEMHSLGNFSWEDKGVKYSKYIFLEGHGRLREMTKGAMLWRQENMENKIIF